VKTITINVSEPTYKDFQRFSRERDRSTSELIREAMDEYRDARIRPRVSLSDLQPLSLGEIKGEIFAKDHDVLEEMLDE